MYGYVLQDWLTVRGTNATPFIQNESDWMGFSSFQDIAFWVDVRELGANLTLNLQTCPTKDDLLFQTMTNCSLALTTAGVPFTPYLNTGAVPKVALSSNPAIPLSTWVRWQIVGPASAWDITFRILASANRVR